MKAEARVGGRSRQKAIAVEGDSISRDTAAGGTRAFKGVREGEAREGEKLERKGCSRRVSGARVRILE